MSVLTPHTAKPNPLAVLKIVGNCMGQLSIVKILGSKAEKIEYYSLCQATDHPAIILITIATS